jgi:hypothetical protein
MPLFLALENDDQDRLITQLPFKVTYTYIDVRICRLAQTLSREVELLWIASGSDEPYNTLAAINVFSLVARVDGRDKLGQQLLKASRLMGEELHLFGKPVTRDMLEEWKKKPSEEIRAISYAAWGAYNWLRQV